ncbi:hypothetical protein L5515_015189 [Caenorhabditis briggsae]|uniref:Serpentine receptor class gamma n=1 Tax=Caenorhabditis briggsae TaxID=6238 RepID=A0AAE9EE29_CAEBR|nr:hypothetical protein L5515_015189 [Caenorhabditis briggsae]
MVLNRMSCVLAPANYDKIWEKLTPISRVIVAILPFGGVWNLIISRVFAQSIQGGFAINYKRAVQWAALSLFQSIYISTALFFTITCTSITIYKLYFLPDRIKSAERALCITSCFISSTFLLVAATQTWKRSLPLIRLLIIFLPIGGTWNLWISKVFPVQQYGGLALSYSRNVHWAALSLFQSIYILTALAFTVICTTVTLYKISAVIVITINKQLRTSISPWNTSNRTKSVLVSVAPG